MIALLLAGVAFAAEGERPRYCDEPQFIIRGEPERHTEPRDEEVLAPEEAADPARARALAAKAGPYGHSELGFRYLARLFGYQGWQFTRESVEAWLIRREYDDYARKKGLWNTWEHWVVKPQKRLAVPGGRLSALPGNGDPTMFFLDDRDRFAHARCVKLELATKLCENYVGRARPFEEKDVVHFAGTSRGSDFYGYCQVYVPPWRVRKEKQLEHRFLGTDDDGSGDPTKKATAK